jgi:N-acetyl-anhydromuramyl-L-alanine amidase AmpD
MADDYLGSTYYPANSNNYTAANRPYSNPIDKIIIHITQGSWSSAINWFQDPNAQASAHYVVRSSDGFIGQSVLEKDIAWHAGNWPYNQTAIGIEHEGYVSDPKWFTEAMYDSSAQLSAYLCDKYGIPVDRDHIFGHAEVPDPYDPGQFGGAGNHTDPGPYWDWDKYMSYVGSYAGSTSAAYAQVVDNADLERFYANGDYWGTSSYSLQRYGPNYVYTLPDAAPHYAWFKLYVPNSGSYDIYGWWPADPGYNDQTAFWIYTTDGWVSATVNQRTNGGQGVYLGTYAMDAGDDWYVLVDNSSLGYGYIVADAVEIVG